MYETKIAIELRDEVKIKLNHIEDRLSERLRDAISNNPYGIVCGYKLTDGKEIGFLVELKNGTTSWFFEKELMRTGSKAEILRQDKGSNTEETFIDFYKGLAIVGTFVGTFVGT